MKRFAQHSLLAEFRNHYSRDSAVHELSGRLCTQFVSVNMQVNVVVQVELHGNWAWGRCGWEAQMSLSIF